MKYAISACLCGVNCKYSGGNNLVPGIKELYDNGEAILICPECFAGLKIPRVPSEILDGRVYNKLGEDLTDYFNKGALITLQKIKENGVLKAILKENSPSCGVNYVYDGSFSGQTIRGMGFTARLLCENGIEVISEKDYEKE